MAAAGAVNAVAIRLAEVRGDLNRCWAEMKALLGDDFAVVAEADMALSRFGSAVEIYVARAADVSGGGVLRGEAGDPGADAVAGDRGGSGAVVFAPWPSSRVAPSPSPRVVSSSSLERSVVPRSPCEDASPDRAWAELHRFVDFEQSLIALLGTHRRRFAAAYLDQAGRDRVWLFLDFELFQRATDFDEPWLSRAWQRWMVVADRRDGVWHAESRPTIAICVEELES